jgi:N-acetylmuramoyl-L-alanine amidase
LKKNIIFYDPKFEFAKPLVPLKKVERIVIHHTQGYDWNAEDVHEMHINQFGWNGIGYNYFIEKDGTIQTGRGLHIGAHARGYNDESIGICLAGNYDDEDLAPIMEQSLYAICIHFMNMFDLTSDDVYGHRECQSPKTCPGLNIDMDKIRERLKKLQESKK